jgi:hypothetical protein
MKKSFYPLLAFLALISTAFACALPFGNGQPSGDQVATIVAATLQALTPVTSVGETPLPEATGLLPHTFYYLGNDSSGVRQVFRIEKDGKTVKQITFEPTAVGIYDVSLIDGSVAYVANNQLLLIQADGSGRRMLVDGGPVDPDNPLENSLGNPVFSLDGQAIAYGYKGLNLYNLTTGVSNRVLEKPFTDPVSGATRQGEFYWPKKYSPDGEKLIITTGIPNSDAIFDVIYYPASKSIVRFTGEPGAFICCGEEEWTQDSLSFYSANPNVGMFGSGLWKVDAATGTVATLLQTDAGGGNFNLADEPYLAPDGQLYFFFAIAASAPNGVIEHGPLQIVRSAADGVTGRTVLRPETFETLNQALWAPDASFVITAKAPADSTSADSVIELYYTDAAKGMLALPAFGQWLKWGP